MAAKKWIFLRGLGRHQEHWADFPEKFRARFPMDQVEMIDLAGTGTERERVSPWDIGEIVEDLRKRMRSKTPVSLLAISMGAMVATEWARRYPKEISEMVLINTSDRGTSKFYERLQYKNYARIAMMLFQIKNREAFERGVFDLTLPKDADPKIHEQFTKMDSTFPVNWLRHTVASAGYQFPKSAPLEKILLLSARNDHLVSPECTRRISKMWDRPHREHPAGAHDLPVADGKWILDQIEQAF